MLLVTASAVTPCFRRLLPRCMSIGTGKLDLIAPQLHGQLRLAEINGSLDPGIPIFQSDEGGFAHANHGIDFLVAATNLSKRANLAELVICEFYEWASHFVVADSHLLVCSSIK